MKVEFSIVVLLTFFSIFSTASSSAEIAQNPKISQWLWTKMYPPVSRIVDESEYKGEALVYMKEQANLAGSRILATKNERGRYVHKALVKTAKESQKDLRLWLDKNEVSFRTYWITNLIVLTNASPEIIEKIAARDDVLRIVGNPQMKPVMPKTSFAEFENSARRIGQNITQN